jgi:hypothetical protein
MVRWLLVLIIPLLTAACNMSVNVKDLAAAEGYVALITVTSPGVADGVTPVTVTITLRFNGAPLAGLTPTYSVTGSGNILGACSVTNASGVSTCSLRSTGAGTKTVALTNPPVNSTATVVFNPAAPPVAGFAITSGGGITRDPGGTSMVSHSSIGIPFSPIIGYDSGSPTTVRSRSGLHGVLYQGN